MPEDCLHGHQQVHFLIHFFCKIHLFLLKIFMSRDGCYSDLTGGGGAQYYFIIQYSTKCIYLGGYIKMEGESNSKLIKNQIDFFLIPGLACFILFKSDPLSSLLILLNLHNLISSGVQTTALVIISRLLCNIITSIESNT